MFNEYDCIILLFPNTDNVLSLNIIVLSVFYTFESLLQS